MHYPNLMHTFLQRKWAHKLPADCTWILFVHFVHHYDLEWYFRPKTFWGNISLARFCTTQRCMHWCNQPQHFWDFAKLPICAEYQKRCRTHTSTSLMQRLAKLILLSYKVFTQEYHPCVLDICSKLWWQCTTFIMKAYFKKVIFVCEGKFHLFMQSITKSSAGDFH